MVTIGQDEFFVNGETMNTTNTRSLSWYFVKPGWIEFQQVRVMRQIILCLIIIHTIMPAGMGQKAITSLDSIGFIEKTIKKVNKNVNFTIIPGPVFGVSQKIGFAVLPMIVYDLKKSDTLSPPSSTAVMFYFDFYGSWETGLKQSLYWNQNKWRAFITFEIGYLHLKYFGIGRDTSIISNADSNYVWSQQKEINFGLTCFRKIFRGLYGGAEFHYSLSNLQGSDSANTEILIKGGIPTGQLSQAVIIPTFVWDNRDNIFWSTKGYYASINFQFSNKYMFSSKDYSILAGWVNGYHSLLKDSKRLILAWHLFAQGGWGDFPYRTYANYCRGDDASGYTGNKYVNYSEVTVQAELRYDLWKSIAFGYYIGTGKIFPSYTVFGQSAWLHFTGVRLYINIIPYRNIRLKLEAAKGRQDYGLYIGIGQAF